MATCELLCAICRSAVIGSKSNAWSDEPMVNQAGLACEACGALWEKFRHDVDQRRDNDAALTAKTLTLRGAVARELHLKILGFYPDDAKRLAGIVDVAAFIIDTESAEPR